MVAAGCLLPLAAIEGAYLVARGIGRLTGTQTGFLDYARTGEIANPARARMYTPQEVARLLPAAGFDVDIEADVEIFAVCRPR